MIIEFHPHLDFFLEKISHNSLTSAWIIVFIIKAFVVSLNFKFSSWNKITGPSNKIKCFNKYISIESYNANSSSSSKYLRKITQEAFAKLITNIAPFLLQKAFYA